MAVAKKNQIRALLKSIETGDPEPMIKALKETLVNLKDAKNTEGHTAVSIIA